MPVKTVEGGNAFDGQLAADVLGEGGQVVGQFADAFLLAAADEDGLAEFQILDGAHQAEADQRVGQAGVFERLVVPHGLQGVVGVDGGLAGGGRGWFGAGLVIEEFDSSAQELALFVDQQDFEAAAAEGDDVEPAVGVFFEDAFDGGGAADFGQSLAGDQHDAELGFIAHGLADHFLVALFENVKWQMPARHQYNFEWKERKKPLLHATIMASRPMILKLKRTPGIYLVGFMGCGKSTVGRALGEEFGWRFVDLDADIEKAEGTPVARIFEERGEPAFRLLEAAALRSVVRKIECGQPHIVALGGGAYAQENNAQMLVDKGVSIWLDCPFEMAQRRVAGDESRPLARDAEKFRALYEQRRSSYARADHRIEVRGDECADVVKQILALGLV